MNRKAKFLRHINLSGKGLEIGASYCPLFPKKEGYNVKILDYESEDALRSRCLSNPHPERDPSKIEHVDFVWKGEPYSELVKGEKFDWIVASHIIEHVPDLIGFINDCQSILNENGILALAIPDKRYTFDYFRMPSSLGSVIDAHLCQKKQPSVGDILDSFFLAASREYTLSPLRDVFKPLDFSRQPSAKEYANFVNKDEYTDTHVWVFTPSHFRLLVEDLYNFGVINLREKIFYPSSGNEFFVFFSVDGKGSNEPRNVLSTRSTKEISVRFSGNSGRGREGIKSFIIRCDKAYFGGWVRKIYRYLKYYRTSS